MTFIKPAPCEEYYIRYPVLNDHHLLIFTKGKIRRIIRQITNRRGVCFHATGGIWFNLSDRFAVFGGFAYETQRLRYANFSDEIIYNKYTNSLSLNIEIAF